MWDFVDTVMSVLIMICKKLQFFYQLSYCQLPEKDSAA
jgi:hypothetical protein